MESLGPGGGSGGSGGLQGSSAAISIEKANSAHAARHVLNNFIFIRIFILIFEK